MFSTRNTVENASLFVCYRIYFFLKASCAERQRKRQLVALLSLFINILKEEDERETSVVQSLPLYYVNYVAPRPLERYWTSVSERCVLIGSSRRRSPPLCFLVVAVKHQQRFG